MIEFWKRRGTLQRRCFILWKPYTQGASFLEVETLLRVRINCMPHTLEQFYQFFACMVKPLGVCFIIPIFYMYDKALDYELYQKRWSERHARLPFKKDECGHAKSFQNIVKNTWQKSSCSNPVALNHFANVHVLGIVALFQKAF